MKIYVAARTIQSGVSHGVSLISMAEMRMYVYREHLAASPELSQVALFRAVPCDSLKTSGLRRQGKCLPFAKLE